MTTPTAGPHLGRSTLAIVAGFLFIVVLSLSTDEVLHLAGVYPPWNEPMWDPGLNALALGYRLVYGILGNLLIYRLAPWKPMKHVWITAGIGQVLALAGVGAALSKSLGPAWYPIALAVSVLPSAWVTGPIARRAFGGN